MKFNSIAIPTAIYAGKTWLTAHKLNEFQQRCLRKLLKVVYRDHITNEEIWKRSEPQKILSLKEDYVLLAMFYVYLTNAKIAMKWAPFYRKHKQGWQRGPAKSHGVMLKPPQLTESNGNHMLPNMLHGIGGAKSKSNLNINEKLLVWFKRLEFQSNLSARKSEINCNSGRWRLLPTYKIHFNFRQKWGLPIDGIGIQTYACSTFYFLCFSKSQ